MGLRLRLSGTPTEGLAGVGGLVHCLCDLRELRMTNAIGKCSDMGPQYISRGIAQLVAERGASLCKCTVGGRQIPPLLVDLRHQRNGRGVARKISELHCRIRDLDTARKCALGLATLCE